MRLIGTIILLVILANVIAWMLLPDAIANLSLIALTLIGLGVIFGVWRARKQ